MLLLRLITPSIWRACSQANDGLGNRINFKVNLRSWRYCVGGWLTFWRRRRDPKQGVGTRLHRQISLDCFTILPAMQATLKFDIEGWKYRQQIQSTFHATCTLSQIVVAHSNILSLLHAALFVLQHAVNWATKSTSIARKIPLKLMKRNCCLKNCSNVLPVLPRLKKRRD